MGYQSPMLNFIEQGDFASSEGQQTDTSVNDIITLITDSITNPSNWGMLGAIAGMSLLGAVFSGGSTIMSFLSMFLPLFILFAVANMLFFPVVNAAQTVDTSGITYGPLGVIMTVVLNVLLLLTVIEFISGRN